MKKLFFVTIFLPAMCIVGCGSGNITDNIVTLDLSAAIDHRQSFDLAEIATDIEFIPLKGGDREGLIGDIYKIKESTRRFYVHERGANMPVKIFDMEGQFVGTRGRIGRGPGEISGISGFVADHETDKLYMSVMTGGMNFSLIAYDPDGGELARADSVFAEQLAIFGDKLVLLRSFMTNMDAGGPVLGVKKPFLESYSLDLRHDTSIQTTEKGVSFIMRTSTDESGRTGIHIWPGSFAILSNNDQTLMVKEALVDTVYYYRDGAMTPGYILDTGHRAIPREALGMDPSTEPGDSYAVRNMLESERYLFVEANGYKDNEIVRLIFDRRDLAAGGFSAMGPGKEPGLFLDGIAFTPMYVRDNNLVGHMQALNIVDARDAGTITRPDLAALAAGLKEDSNPVIVIVTLNQ